MRNIMDVEQVNICLEKLNMYKDQEQLIFDDIKKVFSSIKFDCESNNAKKINGLNIEILKKCDTISNIHNNNGFVLERAIDRYQMASINSDTILNDIVGGK